MTDRHRALDLHISTAIVAPAMVPARLDQDRRDEAIEILCRMMKDVLTGELQGGQPCRPVHFEVDIDYGRMIWRIGLHAPPMQIDVSSERRDRRGDSSDLLSLADGARIRTV